VNAPPLTVSFYDRRGNVVIPTALSIIKPRRGVFALTVALADRAIMLSAESCAPDVPELPGGGIEHGESLDEAIAREWSEEVGIPFDVAGPLGRFQHVRGGEKVAQLGGRNRRMGGDCFAAKIAHQSCALVRHSDFVGRRCDPGTWHLSAPRILGVSWCWARPALLAARQWPRSSSVVTT
jgi:8-oxo-dGTP pyrophosphatase MutT (NUDIX family)